MSFINISIFINSNNLKIIKWIPHNFVLVRTVEANISMYFVYVKGT